MVGGRSDVSWRVGLALAPLLALILLISAPSAKGFEGWWGNTVPVSQIVEEGTEKMGQHLTTFFEMCDRFLSARQKKWAADSSSSTQDKGDEEEAAAQGNDSPFLVERIFHPSAKARKSTKRAPISSTGRCSEPFGVSHPACDSTYACSITQAPPPPSCIPSPSYVAHLYFSLLCRWRARE
jgi:hypothetical protein